MVQAEQSVGGVVWTKAFEGSDLYCLIFEVIVRHDLIQVRFKGQAMGQGHTMKQPPTAIVHITYSLPVKCT